MLYLSNFGLVRISHPSYLDLTVITLIWQEISEPKNMSLIIIKFLKNIIIIKKKL
jgi:hypothetical protein